MMEIEMPKILQSQQVNIYVIISLDFRMNRLCDIGYYLDL